MKANTRGLPLYALNETSAPSRVTPENPASSEVELPAVPPVVEGLPADPHPSDSTAVKTTRKATMPAVNIFAQTVENPSRIGT
jgi:hypothetical protein